MSDEALQLWKDWFKFSDDDPWDMQDGYGETNCFFCVKGYPDHFPDCIYLRAKRLLEQPRQYIVLGMHRSGTSLVARLLKEMGIYMGRNFLEPDEGNPLGYWEDVDFLKLNKQILTSLGGSWRTPFSRKEILATEEKYIDQIQTLLAKRESEHNLWGWKDPRTTMLVWLYHKYLTNPHYIVIRRNSNDIIESLDRVHGNNKDWELLEANYWQHIRDFITHTPKVKYIQLRYANLIEPEMSRIVVRKLADFVGDECDIEPYLELIKC